MKEKLLESARALQPPSRKTADEFGAKREKLAARCTEIFEDRDDRDKLVGKKNIRMAADNNRNFARFMESIFTGYDPRVLVETVLWVFRAYRAHGFQTTYWAANLNIWLEVLEEELSKDAFAEIQPFYSWLIVNIPIFTALTDGEMRRSDSSGKPDSVGEGDVESK